jgi:Ca-activated chloride channel homolog
VCLTWPQSLLIGSLLLSAIGLVAQTEKVAETPYTISLNVDLVILDVSVEERAGKFVSGLEARHFKIFEEGQEQEIVYFLSNDVPITIGLVIDNSGSMRGKRAEVIGAAMAFVGASNPSDEMFVVHFNERVRFALNESDPFTSDPLLLRTALLRMIPDGQTALYDAVSRAVEHLAKGRHDRKALVVISDGGDNASHSDLEAMLRVVHSSHTAVYTINIYDPSDRDQKPGILKRLSKTSGGESFFLTELNQVGPICKHVAAQIRNQYLLAYRPSNTKHDGKFRHVRVKVDVPEKKNLDVRTREGYFAPSADATASATASGPKIR